MRLYLTFPRRPRTSLAAAHFRREIAVCDGGRWEVEVLKGAVFHKHPIGRPASDATPSEQCAFYERNEPSLNIAKLKALPAGTVIIIANVYNDNDFELNVLFRVLDDAIAKDRLPLTVASVALAQGVSPSSRRSPAVDVKQEILRDVDDAVRFDLQRHGDAAPPEAPFFSLTYCASNLGLSRSRVEIKPAPPRHRADTAWRSPHA